MPSDLTTVTLTIDEKPYTLRPTLPAMRTIGRAFGGYLPALRAIREVNPDAFVLAIVAGTNTTGREATKLEEAIYRHGFEDLVAPLIRFISVCMNGGSEPAGDAGMGDAEPKKVSAEDGTPPAETAHDTREPAAA